MVITELQQYLRDRPKVSMAELQLHFGMEPDPLRDILNRLIRKGRVLREDGKLCGGCRSCAAEAIEFYEWVRHPTLPFPTLSQS
ncbi:MAG: FeoC-like transcriptional regulator [Phormidesmis sp.]